MHFVNVLLRDLCFKRRIDIEMIDKLIEDFNRRVEAHTLHMVETFQLTVLRNHGDAVIHGINGAPDTYLLAFQFDIPSGSFCQAKDTLHGL